MGAKIFVGNLHPRTTKSALAELFSAAGRVASISIPADRETGESRGFAFVEFADRESAEEAFSVCDGRELDGRRLRLSWAREDGERSKARRAKWRRESGDSADEENVAGWRGREDRRGRGDAGDYSEDRRAENRRAERRRHGKHGSDRKRRSGTRREIE